MPIEFGKRNGFPVVLFNGRPFVTINSILRAAGQSPQLVTGRIERAILHAQEAAVLLANGDINEEAFRQRVDSRALLMPEQGGGGANGVAKILESIALQDSDGIEYWQKTDAALYNAIQTTLAREDIQLDSAERWVFHDDLGYCVRYHAAGTRRGQRIVLRLRKGDDLYPEHFIQSSAEFHATLLGGANGTTEEWAPDDAGFLHVTDDKCRFKFTHPATHKPALDATLAIFEWKKKMGFLLS